MRKNLKKAGIEILESKQEKNVLLKGKVERLRASGASYQRIAYLFKLLKVKTISGHGGWHAKTIRALLLS
ncbi:MAG: hypothetical protein CME64_14080 [Halobacteriovoraceae bacterium]|nr:hypothetical protein [Halobacteriovoraceae bacterium]